MTDDLVARLRETSGKYDEYCWHSDIELEAADRIEELEAALRDVTTDWDRWQKMMDSDSFTELFVSICEAKALGERR